MTFPRVSRSGRHFANVVDVIIYPDLVVARTGNKLLRVACEQALLFGRAKRVSRERASERRSREGQRKGELATISHKISFVLRSDEGKYHWLKNDVPENKVD